MFYYIAFIEAFIKYNSKGTATFLHESSFMNENVYNVMRTYLAFYRSGDFLFKFPNVLQKFGDIAPKRACARIINSCLFDTEITSLIENSSFVFYYKDKRYSKEIIVFREIPDNLIFYFESSYTF